MTTSGINQGSGPLNALVALGQQQLREGSRKDPALDFAGLLSRLSTTVDAGSDKADPAQPLVKGSTIDTMLLVQRDGQPAPSNTPRRAAQSDTGTESGQTVQAGSEEATVVVANDPTAGDGDLLLVVRADESPPSTDGIPSRGDDSVSQLVQTHGQPEEIQALLSSVMQSVPPNAASKLLQTSAKTTAQATTSAQSARIKTSGESKDLATEVVGNETDAQLPVDAAWQEPVQVSLDHLADSMAPRGKDQSTASAPAADLKLAVLQTETHHAPVLHGGPMAQVADGIRLELGAAGETALTWSPSASATAKPHADAPVKVLLIQLQPADLGTVTVRMALKDDALELQIEASQQDTAQRLQQDQDSLSKVLRSAGYLIDGVAIRAADPDRSLVLPSQTSASLSQSSYQQTAGGAPSEGGASHGRGHEHGARGQARQDTPADANGQRQPPSHGLFV